VAKMSIESESSTMITSQGSAVLLASEHRGKREEKLLPEGKSPGKTRPLAD